MLVRRIVTCLFLLSLCCSVGTSAYGIQPQDQQDKKQDDKKQDDKKQDDEKKKEEAERRQKAMALAREGQGLVQEQKYADAAAKLTEATELYPEFAQAWFLKGYALHMNGDLDEALKAHMKATEFEQFKPTALYNVACAHALKKDKDKALEFLGKAAEAGFTSPTPLTDDSDLEILFEDDKFKELAKKIEGGLN